MGEKLDVRTLEWLRRQWLEPRASYKTAEWAKLCGEERGNLVRKLVKREIIKRGDGSHHEVTRDEMQRHWPTLWRSIQRRLNDLFDPVRRRDSLSV